MMIYAENDVAIVCAELVSHSSVEFVRELSPHATYLHRVRRDLLVWLAGHRADDVRAQELVLAVGEALANAVEHAGAGSVSLRITKTERRRFEATVVDDGHWRVTPTDPTRGRGLTIIHALAEDVQVDRSDRGTRITMSFEI